MIKQNNQRILQAHLKTAQATAHTKVFKRACKANPKEKLNPFTDLEYE